ncbi:MAG: LptF/LptG family permease [Spirochaetia bacterium]
MSIIYRMLMKSFIPVFTAALLFFVVTIELVDLFSHVWQYIQNDASISDILKVLQYYLPKCIGYSLPPALLFAISYTLGSLYASNELIAILGVGIPFGKLIIPFLVLGIFLSGGYFVFHETVIIESYARKNALQNTLLGRRESLSNPNVTVIGDNGKSVFHTQYYNDDRKTLNDLTIVHRDSEGYFSSRIESDWAEYSEEEENWILHNAVIYTKEEDDDEKLNITSRSVSSYRDPDFDSGPSYFQRRDKDVDELSLAQAKEMIESMRRSGRPAYAEALTEYYSRFSFALTPFIVTLISCGIGNRLKKNIVLMSLLFSLILSVIYYVAEMVLGLFAKQGIIVPALGAWGAVIFFSITGLLLLHQART